MVVPPHCRRSYTNCLSIIYRCKDRLREGHLKSVRMQQTINAVHEWVKMKPCMQATMFHCQNEYLQTVSKLHFVRRLTPVCVQAHCESFVRCKTQTKCYERWNKLLKRFQKCTLPNLLTDEKTFNSVEKFACMPKVVIRPKIKCQEFRQVITHTPLVMICWGASYLFAIYSYFARSV